MSISIALPRRRLSNPVVATIVTLAFALGAAAGVALPRLADGSNHAPAAVAPVVVVRPLPAFIGTSMSDAAYGALHPAPTIAIPTMPAFTGTSMSDAAYQALHHRPERDMSDAAYDALHPSTAP